MDGVPEKTILQVYGSRKAPWRYAIALGSVAAGLALRFALTAVLGSTVPYITFFPAVMFAAWFGGFGPGILATVLGLVAAFYFVIPLSGRLNPTPAAEAVGAIVFAGVSIFISILNEALRRSRARSDNRLRELTLETARRSRVEQALADSKHQAEQARDLFQTTLSSIGDAVIATDVAGKVTFLNWVAQDLTGWSQSNAVGKEISEVFVIQNENSPLPVESPVRIAIRDGARVELANHTVLISKDGKSIPIEDSASPIRDEHGRILGAVLVFRDVTNRRKSEDALKRSEERLKLALHSGQIVVWDWDVVQNKIEWSDHVYDIHGIPRGEFPGAVSDFARLIHPDDRERINQAITAALESGAPYDVEFRVVHPNGEVHWVSTAALVFRNDSGRPVRMLGATTDVTARKNAEAHLLQQWHTFDVALSNTPDFTYIFDLQGRFTYANRALLALWQRSLEESVGKNFFDLGYPPELADRLQRQIQAVIETKDPLRDNTPFTGPTGETRHYEYIFVPVFAADGQVEAVTGATRDITDRNNAEEALRKSEERLTFALEAGGGVGTWDWDIPADKVYCNAPFAKLFSIDPDRAAAGAPLGEFVTRIHPDERDQVGASIRQAVDSGGEYAQEYRLVQPDGSVRWIYARGRCHLDELGHPTRFPGVVFDTTERREAEDALRKANRELEEFAYVAGHDLQEPLRMVNIYTQRILRDVTGDKTKLSQYADFVRQGVGRMEVLIRDLLTFSRTVQPEEMPIGTADLSASLTEALSVLKHGIEQSKPEITTQPLPAVRGETSQVAHVFQNLISNALKYQRNGTRPEIHIAAEQSGNEWIISVGDNGIGFEQQYAERIFGLFKRLHKDEYPGTGLGLSICMRIVERYGGRMWAEGKLGQGATFYFTLPNVEGSPR